MNTTTRFAELMGVAQGLQCITFQADVPVFVIPLELPAPYQQPGKDVTRYRARVVQLTDDDQLQLMLITLPETAAKYFTSAAASGGYVRVTMTETDQGKRYWSKPVDSPLTSDEQAFVAKHRPTGNTKPNISK